MSINNKLPITSPILDQGSLFLEVGVYEALAEELALPML
jgi:hypothetical protein